MFQMLYSDKNQTIIALINFRNKKYNGKILIFNFLLKL
jgi:hypothetical protein